MKYDPANQILHIEQTRTKILKLADYWINSFKQVNLLDMDYPWQPVTDAIELDKDHGLSDPMKRMLKRTIFNLQDKWLNDYGFFMKLLYRFENENEVDIETQDIYNILGLVPPSKLSEYKQVFELSRAKGSYVSSINNFTDRGLDLVEFMESDYLDKFL